MNVGAYLGTAHFTLASGGQPWPSLIAATAAAVYLVIGRIFHARQATLARAAYGVSAGCLILALAFQFGLYRDTVLWALGGAALAWTSKILQDHRASWLSTALLAFAVLRLALADAWINTSRVALANPRFFTFLTVAAGLWLSARWTESPSALRLAFYISGHLAMLAALTQEVLDLTGALAVAASLASVDAFAISVLYACYALLLIALGVGTRLALNRIAGLLLIGFVVLKLYTFDVWKLTRLYRTLAFIVLGFLLLSISFLYSHFRALIESWWRQGRQT